MAFFKKAKKVVLGVAIVAALIGAAKLWDKVLEREKKLNLSKETVAAIKNHQSEAIKATENVDEIVQILQDSLSLWSAASDLERQGNWEEARTKYKETLSIMKPILQRLQALKFEELYLDLKNIEKLAKSSTISDQGELKDIEVKIQDIIKDREQLIKNFQKTIIEIEGKLASQKN